MSKVSAFSIKDSIIIFSIVIVFIAVFYIFYIEIKKNSNINYSKKNFYYVKEKLLIEINKCQNNEKNWFSNISCEEKLSKNIISDYFNNTLKLINPYDQKEGVGENPGSVQIQLNNKLIILSIDIDASGGIDIEHKINIY
tara:strand:+ start:115 stop:534 length:420 start_codon:yes stop_codon:yes gene_type:complete